MKLFGKGKNMVMRLFIFLQMMVWSFCGLADEAFAAANAKFSNMATNLTGDMRAFSNTALWAGMVIGIGLIIMGAIKLTKREGEGGLGKALIFIIAGVLAVGIPALVKMAGGSLFDSDTIGTGGVGGVSNTIRN